MTALLRSESHVLVFKLTTRSYESFLANKTITNFNYQLNSEFQGRPSID